MLHIAICDDNEEMSNRIEMLVHNEGSHINQKVDTDVYWEGRQLSEAILNGARYDIIYLDIEMKIEDGITTAKRIREVDKTVQIIFVTSHENYAPECFEVNAFRFISKNKIEERFKKYFLAAVQEVESSQVVFSYPIRNGVHRISYKEILYFESKLRKVRIWKIDGKYEEIYGKLNELEKKVKKEGQYFLRIHQSYLINHAFIKEITFSTATMLNDEKLPISEDRRKIIREIICSNGEKYDF